MPAAEMDPPARADRRELLRPAFESVDFAIAEDPILPRPRTLVAVICPVPAYCHGLADGLRDRRFAVSEHAFCEDETLDAPGVALVISGEADWEALGALARRKPPPAIVAVLPAATPDAIRRALRSGAATAVRGDAPLDEIAEALRAALAGQTILPTSVAQMLAEPGEDAPLSEAEVGWIRELARGVTVTLIAESAGYSERQMYRLIARVYARLGVRGREEALVLATRWGIVEK